MPKVTFGIIVLNGEPFTRYCLRSLYPFAHEIIVVEGGHEDDYGDRLRIGTKHMVAKVLRAPHRLAREVRARTRSA